MPGQRELDTLRGIQVPGRDSRAAATVLSAPPATSSPGTALVMAMLGATLSATVGFIALGNDSHAAKASAARPTVTAIAPTVTTAPVFAATPAPAAKAAETATVIAAPMPAVPVGLVNVSASKNAKVYVDGTLFGTAPITVTAPMGVHTVRIEGAKKNDVHAYDVVFSDEPADLKVEPEARTTAPHVVRPYHPVTRAPQQPAAPAPDKSGMKSEIEKSKAAQRDAADALGDSLGH